MRFSTMTAAAFIALGTVSFAQADKTPAPVDFNKTVVPILQNSCFACHVSGAAQNLPKDPILAKKATKEIADAVEDFAMAPQFPFPADEPTDKQIKHMEKELTKGLMPPQSQAKLGLGAPLSDKDRKVLLAWVAQLKKDQK